MFLKWVWNSKEKQFELRRWFGFGRSIASVYPNNNWHTWDKHGNGGENSRDVCIAFALDSARLSAIMQGFDK